MNDTSHNCITTAFDPCRKFMELVGKTFHTALRTTQS
jgi:hypothetical protein